MIERDGTSCPQCGYPSFAGHGPDCPVNKKAETQLDGEEGTKTERGEYFVDYAQYKAAGGEMSEEDHLDVQRQQGNVESASEKLWDIYLLYRDDHYSRYTAPTDAMESIFAKVDVKFPDKSDEWKFDETMFC